ncbi:hypothetical protein PR002_g31000 [Phytophthora rubi]|uniref:Uncharacterized protein n=1 Tax=Phytophthora rubi TaxID=129364 RepID=A0A6A3GNC4_9STRA|nr:hypothetical protein PR002_g31000 [Phytophthora rubi]
MLRRHSSPALHLPVLATSLTVSTSQKAPVGSSGFRNTSSTPSGDLSSRARSPPPPVGPRMRDGGAPVCRARKQRRAW